MPRVQKNNKKIKGGRPPESESYQAAADFCHLTKAHLYFVISGERPLPPVRERLEKWLATFPADFSAKKNSALDKARALLKKSNR